MIALKLKLIVILLISLSMLMGCTDFGYKDSCLYKVYDKDGKQIGFQCDRCYIPRAKCKGSYCVLTLTLCAQGEQ